MPRTKLRVPSMGSMIQRIAAGAGRVAVLLAEEAVAWEGFVEGGSQGQFGLAVGDGDGALIAFGLDGEGAVVVAHGDLEARRVRSMARS